MATQRFYSWKTTATGIGGLLVGLGMFGKVLNDFLLGETVQMEQLAIALAAISAGLSGIFARDNDVTSEEAGAK